MQAAEWQRFCKKAFFFWLIFTLCSVSVSDNFSNTLVCKKKKKKTFSLCVIWKILNDFLRFSFFIYKNCLTAPSPFLNKRVNMNSWFAIARTNIKSRCVSIQEVNQRNGCEEELKMSSSLCVSKSVDEQGGQRM